MIWLENLVLDSIYLSHLITLNQFHCLFDSNKVEFLNHSYSGLYRKEYRWGHNTWTGILDFLFMGKVNSSLVAQRVKHLPAMREIRVQFLGWEDNLEEEMTTHSGYSCLENPMDGGAG